MRTQRVAGLMKKYLRHGELPSSLEARGTSVGALWGVDVIPAVGVVGTSVARVMGQSHCHHGTQSLTMVSAWQEVEAKGKAGVGLTPPRQPGLQRLFK